MATRETIAGVIAFLDSYRGAFERYDADAAADHFLLPHFIASDAEPAALLPIATREACRAGIEQALALHRKIGVTTGRMLGFMITELSPRLAALDLHFEFSDAHGMGLYDFRGLYSLVARENGWRIAAIAHNQIPRLLTRAVSQR